MSFSVAKKAAQKRLARPNTLNDSTDTNPLNLKKTSITLASNPLYIVHYTDKSFVVLGDTINHSEALVRLGGSFNPNLRIGQGWLFSKTRQASVQKYIDTGEVEPYQYTQDQITNFNKAKPVATPIVETRFSDDKVRSMFKEFREAFDPDEDYEGKSIIDVIRQLEEKYFNELVPVQENTSKREHSNEDKEAKEERKRQREQVHKMETIANMAMINNIVTEKNVSNQSSIVANLITEMKREEDRRRQEEEEDRRRQEEEDRRRQEEQDQQRQEEEDRRHQEEQDQQRQEEEESEPLIKFDDIDESPTPKDQTDTAELGDEPDTNNVNDTNNQDQENMLQTPTCAKFTEIDLDKQTKTVQCVYIDLEKNIDMLVEFSELLTILEPNKELWERLGCQFKLDISGIPGTAVDYMIKFIAELASQNGAEQTTNQSLHHFVAGVLDIKTMITDCKAILQEDSVDSAKLAVRLSPLMFNNGGIKAFIKQ